MSIVRVDKKKNFVVLDKTGLEDPELSFKAKGLLAYLLSKPDNWYCYSKHLAKVGPDGISAVRTGLKELREQGYLEKRPIRGEDGKIQEWESIIREVPQKPSKQETDQKVENPTSGKPYNKKTMSLNKELGLINNEFNKKSNNNKVQQISEKFEEVFQKTLSLELFDLLKNIYDDLDIIYKAILVTEKRTKGIPATTYLTKTLNNWSNKGLKSVEGIDRHLKQLNAHKKVSATNKSNGKTKELHNIEELEKKGWNV